MEKTGNFIAGPLCYTLNREEFLSKRMAEGRRCGMYCGKRGRRRKDGLNRRGKAGDCGEDGAGRKCGCRGRRRRGLYIGILVCVILLHIAAWGSRGFCDWYQRHVFGIWVDTYGRLVGMAPFSVGKS